ncbi:hypothetical protein L5515_019592 [Caenorhabditis briggsae]|uniref:Uncharacterized protein n=1 Tax=Caenorhabditis briggsae TaxID=6238 RepID=A0AAE9JTC9_CAEBR|nr:hypothetical protein L5515_019592 [Caenorhabditis briggsae]
MKLFILLFLVSSPINNVAYIAGSLTLAKISPSSAERSQYGSNSGLLAYRFNIGFNCTEAFIAMNELEAMATSAEKTGSDLSVRIEMDQVKNISMVLSKCGLRSTTSSTIKQNEAIVVSPKYFTIVSNLGSIGCEKYDEPLLMRIQGESNTTGTVSIYMVASLKDEKLVFNEFVIYVFYPVILSISIFIAGCSCPSITFWMIEKIIVIYNDYVNCFGYTRIRTVYKLRGVPV